MTWLGRKDMWAADWAEQERVKLEAEAAKTRRPDAGMDIDPERPKVVKLSPELGAPPGAGARWPGWLVVVLFVLFIAFLVWTQTWFR